MVGHRAKGERIMSEASGGSGRAEMEQSLINRSLEDEDFRQRLLDDPKGTAEQEMGASCQRVSRCGWWRRAQTPSTWCFPSPGR